MTLQDSGGSSPLCRGGAAGGSSSGSSCEPAPTLLQLSATDLQHLILQVGQVSGGSSSPAPPPPSEGLVSTSPFMHRSPLITQEQEGFAAGFIKALADLHKQNQLLGAASHYPCSLPPPPDHPSLCGGETAPGSGAAELDEPQTVPETPLPPPPGDTSSSSSPPSSSSSQALGCIDHEAQERLKAERKRLKNRIAASRCRRRKLERITRLEERVRALKGQNVELAATAGVLREQVAQLRQKVLSHVTSGCHIPDGGSTTSTC